MFGEKKKKLQGDFTKSLLVICDNVDLSKSFFPAIIHYRQRKRRHMKQKFDTRLFLWLLLLILTSTKQGCHLTTSCVRRCACYAQRAQDTRPCIPCVPGVFKKSLYIVDVARVSEMHANQFDTLVTHVYTTHLE